MVGKIGNDSALAREALRAAMRYLPQAAPEGAGVAPPEGPDSTVRLPSARPRNVDGPDFLSSLGEGLRAVDAKVQAADNIPQDLLTGKIDDFHEIAVQLKDAELSFRFAMEIRNKLIDAYREVMRMNV